MEQARSILRANDFTEITGLLESLLNQDSKTALSLISDINEKGANIKELINSILRVLRQILLMQNGAGEGMKADLGTAKWDTLVLLSGKISPEKLIIYIENFQKSMEQLKYTTIPSLPLEVAVIKSCGWSTSGSQIADQTIPAAAKFVAETEKAPVEKPESLDIPSVSTMPVSDDAVIIADKWTYILETIRPYNYSLEALLKQAKLVNCDNANVILEVPYSFHQRILEAPKSRTLLESVLADVLGKSVRVTTVLGKRVLKQEELANVEVAQDDEIVRLASEIFNS